MKSNKQKLHRFQNRVAVSVATLLTLTAVSSFGSDYPTTLSSFHPVGYWRLNETTPVPVGDVATNLGSVGWIGHGEYVEGVVHPVTGIAGDGGGLTAMHLTNANTVVGQAKLRIPWRPEWNTNGPFSVEFWARPDYPTSLGCAASSIDRMLTPNQGWLVYQGDTGASTGNGWYFRVINTSGASINAAVNDNSLDTTRFYHIVGVYDGAHVILYTNGVQAASVAMTGTFQPVTMGGIPLVFGGRADGRGGNLGWGGDMTESAIYNTALSASRVAAHYTAGITPGNGYFTAVQQDNPVGWWRMNEPAYTAPDPTTLPISANSGTLGAVAQGTNYPGVIAGEAGPPCAGMGANNHSVLLNGGMGLINCGADPGLTVPSNCTLTAWVKIRGWSRFNEAMFGKGSFGYQLARSGSVGAVYNMLYGAGGAVIPPGPAAISSRPVFDGYWHHVAGVYDGASMSLYLDGTLDVSGAYTGGMTPTTDPLTIGEVWYGGAPIWIQGGGSGAGYMRTLYDGWIAHVAVLTNALSAPQVQQLFNAAQELPVITLQPQPPAGNIYEGMSITFTTAALGAPTLGYQWTKNGSAFGPTGSSLTLANMTTANSGNYAVIVNNSYGSVTSSVVALTVQTSAPLIFQQPQSITRYFSGSATFTVVAGGSTPLSYQWTNSAGTVVGTGSSYTLTDLKLTDSGVYGVRISNIYGSTNSVGASLTVLPLTAPYSAVVMAGDPVVYWRLNSTNGNVALDFANGYDAAIQGSLSLTTGLQSPGFAGFESGNKSFLFNGAANYVKGPALDLNRSAMTISAWITVTNFSAGSYDAIVTKGDSSWRLHRANNTSGINFGINGPLPAVTCTVNTPVNDGNWHHLVGVYTGSAVQLYLDGQLGFSGASSGMVATNRFPIDIGENAEQTGRYWNGNITEVSLYNRALSAIEITNLYVTATLGTTLPNIVMQPASQSVLVGSPVTFSVGVLGGGPWTYQWQRNGANIAGANASSYSIPSAYYTDAGSYTVGVTNSAGGVPSQSATLTVEPEPVFANLTNAMVVHLKFDGNYSDSSGHGNAGVAVGSPTLIAGKIGSGALHYSTDSASSSYNYVTLNTPTDLQFGPGQDFSMAFWTRFTGLPGSLPFLANNYNSYGDIDVTLAPSAQQGGWSWYINDAFAAPGQGIGASDPVGATLNNGQWHNLVYTFARSNLTTVYLDGAIVGQTSIAAASGWNFEAGYPWNIGQASGSYAADGQFDMDDLGIWRRALSQAEAESVYIVGQTYGLSFDSYGPIKITANLTRSGLELIWQAGTLLSSDNANGPWAQVLGASAPYYKAPIAPGKKFYRVQL